MVEKKYYGTGCKYSRKETMLLFETFQELDKSGDGSIDTQELNTMLPRIHQARDNLKALQVFRSLDNNKDGKINFKEMLQGLYPMATKDDLKIMYLWAYPKNEGVVLDTGFKLTAGQRKELEDMFKLYDKDGSGGLDHKELVAMVQNTGYAEDEIEDLFQLHDKNKDTKIDLNEFVEMMQSLYM